MKLVTSFDWLDLSALNNIEEEFHSILEGSLFVEAARRDALCQALRERVDMLVEIVNHRTRHAWVDNRSADVRENVAYSGKQTADVGED